MLKTSRLQLRSWRDTDRDIFAELHSHPEVMADLGGPFTREKSNRKFDRYVTAYEVHGYGRWVIEDKAGTFLGYVGIMHIARDHPLGPHDEIGWRLMRSAWGQGYASEAAKAALDEGFARLGLSEVLSYTSPTNLRSQSVMNRIGMQRDKARDFTAEYEGVNWQGLVWAARPAA